MIPPVEHPAVARASAPALSRGLVVLGLLGDGRSRTLEDIARATKLPKSSLLRLLETLAEMNLVARDDAAKQYRALARLVPAGPEPSLDAVLPVVLERLARATRQTAEWYVPAREGMVLVRRAEAVGIETAVRASVGFNRAWVGELEAVCCVGWAFFRDEEPSGSGFWAYVADGKRHNLTSAQAQQRIAEARQAQHLADTAYNSNGVRRAACVVLRSGKPVGVLAVAEHLSPGRGDRPDDLVHELVREARSLGAGPAAFRTGEQGNR